MDRIRKDVLDVLEITSKRMLRMEKMSRRGTYEDPDADFRSLFQVSVIALLLILNKMDCSGL